MPTTRSTKRTREQRRNGAEAVRKRDTTSGQRRPQGAVQRLIARRVASASSVEGPSRALMRVQSPIWDLVSDLYFRVEVEGWERVPDQPSLLIGVHSGGALTMDAWTLVQAWYRHFGEERILHGTAHDVLMAAPGLGDYFRLCGVIPASRKGVTTALDAGHDVVVWPGGEQDAMRSWRKRDTAVLAGRKGFVKQAIRSGVPIVPVATVGGHDTVFVLSEGRWLADGLERLIGLKSRLRGATLPIIAGFPFPLALEITPMHLPLPAKIRTELLDPIHVDTDPERAQDQEYVDSIYREVEAAIQVGMDRLARRRRFPVFG
jgi:1-acyl-sn-glycerol-3-phosphate acyltransferase